MSIRRRWRIRNPRGFAMVEVVLAVLIVGGLLAAVLNTVSASRLGQYRISEQVEGELLARDLMAEILGRAYEEPDGSVAFGPEDGEPSGTGRAAFDDVDDYEDWRAEPPQYRDGSAIPGAEGFRRRVRLDWVEPGDLDSNSSDETGVKLITVRVEYRGRDIVELVAFRTRAWVDPVDAGG